jgi:hypothetical protein
VPHGTHSTLAMLALPLKQNVRHLLMNLRHVKGPSRRR